jgi:hypothetical protein
MHSLFLRIFVLFWIAMAIIVGGSIAVTFTVAAREYESREFQHRPAVAVRASEVLAKGGVPALKKWLTDNEHSMPDRNLYIIGPDGRDILGRRLSDNAARRLEIFNRESTPEPDSPGGEPPGAYRPIPFLRMAAARPAQPRRPVRHCRPPSRACRAQRPAAVRRPETYARSAPCRRYSRRTARPTRSCWCRAVPVFSARSACRGSRS